MQKIIIAALLLFSFASAKSQDQLIVNVREFKPMVMRQDGELTGFDIELFREICDRIGKSVVFNERNVNENLITILDSSSKSDASIAGITITKEREEVCDFSHTYFRSGLMILVRKGTTVGLLDNFKFYFNTFKRMLPLFIGFFIYTLIAAYLVYRFEIGNSMFADDIKNGIFDGWYWVNVVLTTVGFGDKVPLSKKGKLTAVILMWTGIFFMVPAVTASISSEFTARRLTSHIQDKSDLRGRKVAVKRETVTVDFIRALGARLEEVKTVEDGVDLLKIGKVEAVVHDVPAIRYAEQNNDGIQVIGSIFGEQDYGIALPQGSPLREKINRYLLEIMSDGTYEKIYNKYFGG
jgi:polar amino acid transport system substrate-binding protein